MGNCATKKAKAEERERKFQQQTMDMEISTKLTQFNMKNFGKKDQTASELLLRAGEGKALLQSFPKPEHEGVLVELKVDFKAKQSGFFSVVRKVTGVKHAKLIHTYSCDQGVTLEKWTIAPPMTSIGSWLNTQLEVGSIIAKTDQKNTPHHCYCTPEQWLEHTQAYQRLTLGMMP